MGLEREEVRMQMKENHEHIDFNGWCDDWEEDIHA